MESWGKAIIFDRYRDKEPPQNLFRVLLTLAVLRVTDIVVVVVVGFDDGDELSIAGLNSG